MTVLKRFGPMVYVPTVLFSLGEGAVIPLIPVLATRLGADVASAALVSAALVVGQLVGNLPAGWAVAKIGERYTMVAAGLVAMLAAVGMPLLIKQYGGDPAVVAAIGMLAGFCGTLMTPMAANFNLVPAALLELKNPYGVIKAQIGTAVPLLAVNIVFIWLFAF